MVKLKLGTFFGVLFLLKKQQYFQQAINMPIELNITLKVSFAVLQKFISREEYVLHLIHTFAYIRASEICKDLHTLDIGCNTGYGSHILSRFAKKVIGVDVSESAIEFANNHYAQFGIQYKMIDGKTLPFKDNEFDMVVCCQVIEHIVDYNIFIGEIKRVLSPEGIVFFTTPNALLRIDPGMKPWNKFHVREFVPHELISTLKPFFENVREFGLLANEPLYSVERNRLENARKNARNESFNKPIDRKANILRSLIKFIIPEQIYSTLRRMYHSIGKNKNEEGSNQTVFSEFDINDLFYKESDLENAIDLLAICSDDKNTMKKIYEN